MGSPSMWIILLRMDQFTLEFRTPSLWDTNHEDGKAITLNFTFANENDEELVGIFGKHLVYMVNINFGKNLWCMPHIELTPLIEFWFSASNNDNHTPFNYNICSFI